MKGKFRDRKQERYNCKMLRKLQALWFVSTEARCRDR